MPRSLQYDRVLCGAVLALMFFGILMVAMAVSERGFMGTLVRERRVDVRPSRLGEWAPPVMGLAFGFAWTPCIGPVLTVILATASLQETLGRGVLLLVAYSLGLGIPFLLMALAFDRAPAVTRPLLRYSRQIEIVGGAMVVLLGLALIFDWLGIFSRSLVSFWPNV